MNVTKREIVLLHQTIKPMRVINHYCYDPPKHVIYIRDINYELSGAVGVSGLLSTDPADLSSIHRTLRKKVLAIMMAEKI